tara:strand:- start:328 stop:663 length:336 start_codon:yes stop_codon:yes gene_type:complete
MTPLKSNPYIKDLIFFLAAIVVSMAGFWMMTGRDMISRDEAAMLVRQQTIAIETKLELYHEGLLVQENRLTKQEEKLERVLEKNTEAINELRVQIATLSQALSIITDNRTN